MILYIYIYIYIIIIIIIKILQNFYPTSNNSYFNQSGKKIFLNILLLLYWTIWEICTKLFIFFLVPL